jgi:hypothetical protein
MQRVILDLTDDCHTLDDRRMLATRRIILRKLSARMKNEALDANNPSDLPPLVSECEGQTMSAH